MEDCVKSTGGQYDKTVQGCVTVWFTSIAMGQQMPTKSSEYAVYVFVKETLVRYIYLNIFN